MSVTYEAVLDVSEDSVLFLSGLLHAERVRRGTRKGTRALSTHKQAVLVLRVDLWWSGKHSHHGGNIQVVSAPYGWPLWTSDVRPGREHDTTAARADPVLLHQLRDWIGDGAPALADLGYEGEPEASRSRSRDPNVGN